MDKLRKNYNPPIQIFTEEPTKKFMSNKDFKQNAIYNSSLFNNSNLMLICLNVCYRAFRRQKIFFR